jgi:hypothetical protein
MWAFLFAALARPHNVVILRRAGSKMIVFFVTIIRGEVNDSP